LLTRDFRWRVVDFHLLPSERLDPGSMADKSQLGHGRRRLSYCGVSCRRV
jgi:hypothetical protein